MITNKIIQIIISITAIIIIPVQFITTFILGLLVRLSFGLLLFPLNFVWITIFYGPLFGLSYLYEKITFLRPLVGLIGIPFAVVGNMYVALIPSMGEMESRFEKMLICQTFPCSWKFKQLQNDNIDIEKNDILNNMLREITKTKPLKEYLDNLKAEIYSRASYLKGDVKIDW